MGEKLVRKNVANAKETSSVAQKLTGWSWFGSIKQIWVIANLAQLHQNIQQANSIRPSEFVEFMGILIEHLDIPIGLHLGQTNVQLGFLFRWQCRCDVLLDPTQHEWSQDGMELFNDIFLAGRIAHAKVFIKLFGVSKYVRHDKVQKGKEFTQVVLQRRPRYQQPMFCVQRTNSQGET